MTISISAEAAIGREMSFPRRITVTLECESMADIFCRGSEQFQDAGGYVAIHGKAMDAGWLERQSDQGRQWVCPRCSER